MSFSILGLIAVGGLKLPLCSFRVPAGFPSPAADHIEAHISLDEVLNIRAPHVYLVSIAGESMQPAKATKLMAVLDQINGRWGRGTLRSASVPGDPDWGMRREMMSQSYTTKLDQLWRVHCH
ncbi:MULTISPECIES: DUF4113 domain-containing protein [Pseudomonas]|uniref:DUF4113 domain-containing protein n=1 Tax=Pseudomonas TaxID=286 RepID=UPI000AC8A008|nr:MULTISPECIES: DUF4113 domain-containing protein [Pseudomonas]